jgi:hypothetical protein
LRGSGENPGRAATGLGAVVERELVAAVFLAALCARYRPSQLRLV